jgi:uncharacterized protein YdeI (YjbR/CyaY-like superfamily)
VRNANPKVDAWLGKAKSWQPEMRKLRSIILECGLGEELKWYKPVYTFGKKNVVIVMALKETVALAFCKGALLKDPKHVLARIGENSQAGRWIKFTSVREIAAMATTVKAYIREAIAVEEAGLEVPTRETSDYPVAEELKRKLAELPAFKKAFAALTPGRQRGYLLYFSGAKQSKTREARIVKSMPLIFEGRGLLDEYNSMRTSRAKGSARRK